MLPLREFKKRGYTDAKYIVAENGNDMGRSIVVATKRKEDLEKKYNNWYDDGIKLTETVSIIPRHLQDIIREKYYTIPIVKTDLKDISRRREGLNEVFTAKIVSVLEAAPIEPDAFQITRNGSGLSSAQTRQLLKGLIFEDYLVCEPNNPNLKGLKVYVPYHLAGMGKVSPRRMIDRYVPIKIIDLKQRHYENYDNRSIENFSYVAVGDIELAEMLINNTAVETMRQNFSGRTHLNQEEQSIRDQQIMLQSEPVIGRVNYIDNSGVHVIDSRGRTYKIPASHFHYSSLSSLYRDQLEHYIDDDRMVKFKLTGYREEGHSPIFFSDLPSLKPREEFKDYNKKIILWGSTLEFDEHPYEKAKRLIDEGNFIGSVHTAYITRYDSSRNHLVEFEDMPGVSFKLRHSPQIKREYAYTRQPLSVRVMIARYGKKQGHNDEDYSPANLIFKVHCDLNTVQTNLKDSEDTVGFFTV